MKRGWLGVLGVATAAFVASVAPVPAWAAPITFDLNCGPQGNTDCPPITSFGTITIADNASDGNKIDITIDLTGDAENKYKEIYLNLDPSLPIVGWTIDAGGGTLTVGTNAQVLSPYNGAFDLLITDPATDEPHTYTLSLASTDLDPSDFNFTETLGLLFASVHVQDCGPSSGTCNPGENGTSSIKVGSTGTTGSNEQTAGSNEQTTGSNEQTTGSNEQTTGSNEQTTGTNEVTVPGPAPLALVGVGLIGLAIGARRRRR